MSTKDKVLVLGGGHIGSAIAKLLYEADLDVTVLDQDPIGTCERLNRLNEKTIPVYKLEINGQYEFAERRAKLCEAIRGHSYVINALPYYLNHAVMHACADEQSHYLDMTEDVESHKLAYELAKQNPFVYFAPACGLAPGAVSVIAGGMIQKFWKVEEVTIRVGAIPINHRLPGKHSVTWSLDGLAHEYMNDATVMCNGKVEHHKPLTGYETLSIDNTEYEAFSTSGGIGTLIDSLYTRFPLQYMDGMNVNYKTVRWPGHHAILEFLVAMENEEEFVKMALDKVLRRDEPDQVVIKIEVTGWGYAYKEGTYKPSIPYAHQRTHHVCVYEKVIRGDRSTGLNAIQLATASGVCQTLSMMMNGYLPKLHPQLVPNFIVHELLDDLVYRNSYFGSVYLT